MRPGRVSETAVTYTFQHCWPVPHERSACHRLSTVAVLSDSSTTHGGTNERLSTFRAVLGDDGRVVIPAAERRRLGFHPGDTLIGESDGTSILLRSHEAVIREVQEFFSPYKWPGVSEVDELIAERRAEAAREEGEAGHHAGELHE